eukprot:jgi/Galph1/1101/GphlegSOOS_G5844.1
MTERSIPHRLLDLSRKLGKILASDYSKNALRASLAAIGINVVVFFAVLRKYIECFVGMFAFAIPVIVAQHTYIGAMLEACILYSWGGLLSVVLAMTALAIADGTAIGLYFATLVEACIVAILRTEPQYLGYGIVLSFLFGAILVYDVKVPPSEAWDKTFPLVVAACAAACASFVSSLVIFPQSARRQLRLKLANMLEEIGKILEKLSNELVLTVEENNTEVDVVVDDCRVRETNNFEATDNSLRHSSKHSSFGIHRITASEIGSEILQSCLKMRSSFVDLRAMVRYIPFEPNLFPPWSAEPRMHGLHLLIKALAGVLRRDHCFSVEVLGSSLIDVLQQVETTLYHSKEYGTELSKWIRNLNDRKKTMPDMSFVDTSKNSLDEYVVAVTRQHWNIKNFYTERERTVPFASAAFIFVVFNVHGVFQDLKEVENAIHHIQKRREDLRFAPAKNLLFWIPTLLLPFKGWWMCYTYIFKPDNIRYLVKYMLCVAIILFPTMFVAQFSSSDFHFTQTYNAISAYIIVTILFWRGSALAYAATVFAPTMPWVLEIWLWFWTYVALLTAYHFPGYVIGTFPLVIAQFFIISCQYGHGFTFLYAASRTVSVAVGCGVVLFVSYFIWPYKGSVRIRQLLTGLISTFEAIYCALLEAFLELNKDPNSNQLENLFAEDSKIRGLFSKADGMVTGCRMMLVFELSPNYLRSSIPQVLNDAGAVFRRLALLRFICATPPSIYGKYTGNIYCTFLQPMGDELSYITQTLKNVVSAICERVGKPREERTGPKRLEEALEQLLYAKRQLGKRFDELRTQVIEHWRDSVPFSGNHETDHVSDATGMAPTREGLVEVEADDYLRFLAWIYCIFITLEAFERLAHTGISLLYEKRDDLKTIIARNAKPV